MASLEGYVDHLETLDARQFVIALRRLADSLSYGIDRSPFVGSGIEFAQSRPYQDGDPMRQIDWRVTARMGKHYVKEYETPKSMPCYFLLDTSASMTVSSVARSKYATMLFIAGGLSLAFLDRVSPVGAVSVGGRALHVRPSLSQARVLEWLLALQHFSYGETTALGARIGELLPSLSSRSMFVVLSDLHDPEALPGLKRLSQRHDCVVIQLRDPAESGLRGSGFLRAREAETGREFTTTGRRRWIDDGRAAIELRRAGIDHLLVHTDRPFEPALRHLFKGRSGIGRGAR